MKKMFKQEFAETIDDNNLKEIKNLISDSLDHVNSVPMAKHWYTSVFNIFSIFVIFSNVLFAWLSYNVGEYFTYVGHFFAIIASLALIGLIINIVRKKQKWTVITKNLKTQQEKIYKLWFEKNYSDVSFVGNADIDAFETCAKIYNSQFYSSASIKKVIPGYWIKSHSGINIQAAKISWGLSDSGDGIKSSSSSLKAYLMISGVKSLFEDVNFEMRKKSFLDKVSTTLENEDFNNAWFYKCSDDVKLRMILTPSIQEDILKVIKNPSFSISKINDIFWVSIDLEKIDSTFEINFRNGTGTPNKDFLANELLDDCLDDIKTFQTWLSYITVFRTLFETE